MPREDVDILHRIEIETLFRHGTRHDVQARTHCSRVARRHLGGPRIRHQHRQKRRALQVRVFEYDDDDYHRTNYVRFRLGPDEVSVALGARSKAPGDELRGQPVELFVCTEGPDEVDAYERLLADALQGLHLLFASQQGVEATWKVVDNVLHNHHPAIMYEPGSWGPKAADALLPPLL